MSKGRKREEKEFTTQCTAMFNSIDDALYVIGGKWKIKIIVALLDGGKRFNELQRAVKGISAKVLSNELKQLEINNLVSRNIIEEWPIVVEYELTEYSKSLEKVLKVLSDWGAVHKERIKRCMERDRLVNAK